MTMYNCHHDGDQYRITKFTNSGDVQSSYLCDHVNCECPAGVRDTCRHRQMLPTFLEQGLVNSHLFLDWDRGRHVVDFNGHPALPPPHIIDEVTPIDPKWFEPATVRSREDPTSDLAPQALTDTCAQADPMLSPNPLIDDLPMTTEQQDHVRTGLPPAAWRRF